MSGKPNDWGPQGRYPNLTPDERLLTCILMDSTAGDPPDGWLVLIGEHDDEGVRSAYGPFIEETDAILHAEGLRILFDSDPDTAGGLIKVVPVYDPEEMS